MILHEATRLFAEQGYSSTSIRQVVEACKCTKPALYYYFKGKEALFSETVRIQVDAIGSVLQEMLDGTGSFRERLHASIGAFLTHFKANPMGVQLMQRLEMNPEEGMPTIEFACGQELHMRMMTTLLERAIESGELRDDLDVELATLTLDGAIRIHFQLALTGHQPLTQERIGRAIDMILDGIAKR